MNGEIKYNVTTIIKKQNKTEKEILELFNIKLLRIILSLENKHIIPKCQM